MELGPFLIALGITATISVAVIGALWRVLTGQMIDLARRLDAFDMRFKDIHEELEKRRHEFLHNVAFSEFKDRVNQYMAQPFVLALAFEAWKNERDILIDQIQRRLKSLEDRGKP